MLSLCLSEDDGSTGAGVGLATGAGVGLATGAGVGLTTGAGVGREKGAGVGIASLRLTSLWGVLFSGNLKIWFGRKDKPLS